MNDTVTTLISDIYNNSVVIPLVAVVVLVAAVASAGNVFVIIAIIKSKNLRRPLYILFINFNMAELLLSTLIIPVIIVVIISDGNLASDPVCFYVLYGNSATISASAITLSFIALYRLAQICYSKIYSRIKKPAFVASVVIITWGPNLILCGIFGQYVHFNPYYLTCEFTGSYIYILSVALVYGPVCVFIFLSYIKIFIHTRNSQRKIRDSSILQQLKEGVPSRPSSSVTLNMGFSKENQQKHFKVFQTIAFIFLDFVLFYFIPGLIRALRETMDNESLYGILMLVAFILQRFRPLASLVLYFLTNSELRENALMKLCRPKDQCTRKRGFHPKIRIDVIKTSQNFAEQQNSNSKASSGLSVFTTRPLDITSEAGSTCHSPSISNLIVSHM